MTSVATGIHILTSTDAAPEIKDALDQWVMAVNASLKVMTGDHGSEAAGEFVSGAIQLMGAFFAPLVIEGAVDPLVLITAITNAINDQADSYIEQQKAAERPQ